MNEKQIKDLMESLDLTREEAIELIEFDKGDVEIEEVEEMTKKAKTMQKTETKQGRKPRAKGEGVDGVTTMKRAKKENPTKATVIEQLFRAIQELEGVTNAENPNKEKTITFELDGNTYEIDLKQKRKPKN